jgi:vacuolar-type H+-ATPase subunit D/Vma8
MKSKLKGAQTGHSLLKRKSEALTKSVAMGILRELANTFQALSRYTRPI